MTRQGEIFKKAHYVEWQEALISITTMPLIVEFETSSSCNIYSLLSSSVLKNIIDLTRTSALLCKHVGFDVNNCYSKKDNQ